MSESNGQRGGLSRTRRNFVKAAGIAAAALAALPVASRPAKAQWRGGRGDDGGYNGGGYNGGGQCFLRGTEIRTPSGYRKIEELAVGDSVTTSFSGARPIRWIGSYSFARQSRYQPWPIEARPVRIMRSAIDDNVPHTDLYVTAAHALYIDGVLVPAGDLVGVGPGR